MDLKPDLIWKTIMSIDACALFATLHISNAETGNICIEMQKGFVVCWVF